MFSFFAPRPVKESRTLLKHARKLLHYKRDRLKPVALAELEESMAAVQNAAQRRDLPAMEKTRQELEAAFARHVPATDHPGWRENCEVFLVAIVVAVGVRTFFLQPFTIPTGSMQPTLNGIIAHRTGELPPNPLTRVVDFLWRGRTYLNVVAKTDDQIVNLVERRQFVFFTATEIICQRGSYRLRVPRDRVIADLGLIPGKTFKAGEPIVRGYVEAGDHVFVDKISYHFVGPHRSNVFVFNTQNITVNPDEPARPGDPSQFYIKRLAGVPGDELRIAEPELFLNGERARESVFQRVMSRENGYPGYRQGDPRMMHLRTPHSVTRLAAGEYFALGDNSASSLDSRYWGTVPERNLMGRGLFVYWPFGKHWGFIQ